MRQGLRSADERRELSEIVRDDSIANLVIRKDVSFEKISVLYYAFRGFIALRDSFSEGDGQDDDMTMLSLKYYGTGHKNADRV